MAAAKGSRMLVVAAAALMCLLVAAAPRAAATITCRDVALSTVPCLGYLRGTAPLSDECCNGVRTLNAAASTTEDRQAACGCLKSLASQILGLKPELAAGIPDKCGVVVGYPITLSTDCSQIH